MSIPPNQAWTIVMFFAVAALFGGASVLLVRAVIGSGGSGNLLLSTTVTLDVVMAAQLTRLRSSRAPVAGPGPARPRGTAPGPPA